MTARDDAADAIYELLGDAICKRDGKECGACRREAEAYVDAIPDDILVDLAVDRGALTKVGDGNEYTDAIVDYYAVTTALRHGKFHSDTGTFPIDKAREP